jgi:hypothetical protein
MTAYANLHLIFEQMRIRARLAERGGTMPEEDLSMGDDHDHEPPRILVIGPEHSGKTTACKILANYAVRGMATYTPLYINLDPSEVRLYLHFYNLLYSPSISHSFSLSLFHHLPPSSHSTPPFTYPLH